METCECTHVLLTHVHFKVFLFRHIFALGTGCLKYMYCICNSCAPYLPIVRCLITSLITVIHFYWNRVLLNPPFVIMNNILVTVLRHATWSHATTAASLYNVEPKGVLIFSAVLNQVSLSLPRLLFPSGAQVDAVLSCWLASILRMWPINF